MKKNAGFSLIELMVVIAIVGTLSAIAIPNVINWRNNAQVNSAARGLLSDLQNARSMAVKENLNCTVLFNDDGSYTLFMERPAAANLILDNGPGERVLKTVRISTYGAVSIDQVNFPLNGTDGNPAITFRPTGFPFNAAGELAGGNVVLRGASNKRVVLTPAGSIRIETI
jgi:type IV fimbrial biogenesis protein FimT